MRFLGASQDELLFVVFLVLLVLFAPKMPKIGELVGALFERRAPSPSSPPATKSGDRPGGRE
jgi:hypothetical protein